MKKFAVIAWLAFLCAGIAAIFWYNEWVYKLPTPVPVNYIAVNKGEKVVLEPATIADHSKPTLVHFFNPDCPCSRFNMSHFKALEKEYNNRINFVVAVISNHPYEKKDIQDRFGIDTRILFDSSLATRLGVYSTPQAVIIDASQKIYYRGNYNRTRYCTDKKTEYARIALNSLLQNNDVAFSQYALTAYGCQLPKCTK
jgi:hypothetical protein